MWQVALLPVPTAVQQQTTTALTCLATISTRECGGKHIKHNSLFALPVAWVAVRVVAAPAAVESASARFLWL